MNTAIIRSFNIPPKFPFLLAFAMSLGTIYYYEKKMDYLKKQTKIAPHELY